MVDDYFDPSISIRDFHSHEEPELSLVMLRGQIEGRLRWLEHYLVPDAADPGRKPGQSLTDRGLIDSETFGAISQVLEAANLYVHGRRVDPTTAATIVETGFRLITLLDDQIETTRQKISGLRPEARLIYRLLELPTTRRNQIARNFGASSDSSRRESRVEQAREILNIARESKRLSELWDRVQEASVSAEIQANPFNGG